MELETILTLVSIGLGLIATVFGGRWLIVKGKANQFKSVVAEAYDVVNVAVKAIDDDKITKAELEEIKQEAAEFKAAVKLLFAKTED